MHERVKRAGLGNAAVWVGGRGGGGAVFSLELQPALTSRVSCIKEWLCWKFSVSASQWIGSVCWFVSFWPSCWWRRAWRYHAYPATRHNARQISIVWEEKRRVCAVAAWCAPRWRMRSAVVRMMYTALVTRASCVCVEDGTGLTAQECVKVGILYKMDDHLTFQMCKLIWILGWLASQKLPLFMIVKIKKRAQLSSGFYYHGRKTAILTT